PDGQLYVNLRGHAQAPPLEPAEALARFLHALGVPAGRVPVEVEEAAAIYRTMLADKRMLVVLDNAHHPDQVRPLLPGSPGCLVLVTSRDAMAGLVALAGSSPVRTSPRRPPGRSPAPTPRTPTASSPGSPTRTCSTGPPSAGSPCTTCCACTPPNAR